MNSTVSNRAAGRHLPLPENTAGQAKAPSRDLRKPENPQWIRNGQAIGRAQVLSGLLLKEFADACEKDERQVARWILATERPQLETVLGCTRLRKFLVIALAEQDDSVEVVTEIRVKRTA